MSAQHGEHRVRHVPHPDPAISGMCEPMEHEFHHLAVHLALLHTGNVLAFGGSGNERRHLDSPLPAEVWDPSTGEVRLVKQALAGDIFCAGHAFLPDGRLLVAGGTLAYEGEMRIFGSPIPPFRGMDQAYTFDPVAESWTRVENLERARWYPTLVTLGDGRVLAAAGLMERFPWVFRRSIEVYAPGSGWQRLEDAERWLPLYPRLHLLPSGEVFYAGSFNTHYTFPFVYWAFPTSVLNVQTRSWRAIGLPQRWQREEGASVLLSLVPPDYRPRVLLAGGGSPQGREVTADVEIIDLAEPEPRWRHVQPLGHPRYYVYPVILPDRRVLVIGGRQATGHAHPAPGDQHEGRFPPQDPQAVRQMELFDPETETWTTMAALACDRLYHSAALLLPDGRVMIAGSNPGSGLNEPRIETYRPPYFFQGERPSIANAQSEVSYGEALRIDTPDANAIDEVALIKPGSTTHCLNTDQRHVGLPIESRGDGSVVARVPANPNLAPPGYYMLFILRDGIPSVARFVHVQ